MKHLVLSHADLDGIHCAINIRNIVKDPDANFQYKLTGYPSLDKNIINLKYDEFDILWITDLNLRDYHIRNLAKLNCKKVIHFDHHIYEYDVMAVARSMPDFEYIFIHDTQFSSTWKIHKWLHNKFSQLTSYRDLSKDSDNVNSYDMWHTGDFRFEVGYAMNDLYWEYGSEKYFLKFRDGFILDAEDKSTLIRINLERNDYIEDTRQNFSIVNEDASVLYVFNPKGKHTNHFTIVNNYKYYVILKEVDDSDNIQYSIRLRGDIDLTIQKLFAIMDTIGIEVISSGGHKTVGSICFPKKHNEKFLESINKIFEEY